jgi:hypothetical protein
LPAVSFTERSSTPVPRTMSTIPLGPGAQER